MIINNICFNSDNSEIIASHIENISDKHEESGSDDTVRKVGSTVSEKVLGILYEKKKLSEISASSSSSSSNSSSSDSDTDNSSGNYLYKYDLHKTI